jgi:hypothetical protein
MSPVTLDPAAFQGLNSEELARQLYDVLMADIEPDLLLENLSSLDAKYTNETPQEKELRLSRYEAAYKRFDQEFNEFMAQINAEVHASRRAALQEKEAASDASDQQALTSLESAFG